VSAPQSDRVTDEVYEHLVYESPHLSLASLAGMAERTITISSAAKTFSFTGWKVGWACARPELIRAIRTAKQFLTFVNAAPFQYAIAEGLTQSDDYLVEAAQTLRQKRDLLAAGLDGVGFHVFAPPGTFFLTTDIAPLSDKDFYTFCLELAERCGVVAIRVRSSTTTRSRAGTWCVGCFQSVSKCSRKRSNAWSDFDDS